MGISLNEYERMSWEEQLTAKDNYLVDDLGVSEEAIILLTSYNGYSHDVLYFILFEYEADWPWEEEED